MKKDLNEFERKQLDELGKKYIKILLNKRPRINTNVKLAIYNAQEWSDILEYIEKDMYYVWRITITDVTIELDLSSNRMVAYIRDFRYV